MLVTALVALSLTTQLAGATTDFADSRHADAWLHHPVVGDVSFDSFEREPGNPIHRGSPPYEWPVNGFLFHDPVSGRDYCYVGEYAAGYALKPEVPSRCVVLRAREGGGWEKLGPIFAPERHTFDGEVSPVSHAPDVSVVYADGRYHLCYDWTTENTTWANAAAPPPEANSGVGYAWAEHPEGPFHQVAHPIASTREQPLLSGRYRRLYASTLIRREHDWLVLTLTDSGPCFGWALLGMTARTPEGPYSSPVLLLHPDSTAFLPPLLEWFPAFTHEGFIYAPATSVARNRNYQAIYRVPIERAMEADAWEPWMLGSVWHAEPVEHEAAGIWGQAFSGYVDDQALFHVMFPSRDPGNQGTINLARRPWGQPQREHGFVVSAPGGPSLALLRRSGKVDALDIELEARGTWSLFWDATMPIGPDRPASDSIPHPHTMAYHTGLRVSEGTWTLYQRGTPGDERQLAQGNQASPALRRVRLERNADGQALLKLNDTTAWQGELPATSGMSGLLMEPGSWARVERFEVDGDLAPAPLTYFYTEALSGAAQRAEDWDARVDPVFRYGVGAISKAAGAAAKWNFEGNGFELWAPQGPNLGAARLLLDGKEIARINYHAEQASAATPLFTKDRLDQGRHTVMLQSDEGLFPVDLLVVHSGP